MNKSNLTIETKGKIAFALMNPAGWITKVDSVFQKLDGFIIREYKKESPVDRGDLRRNVRKQEQGILSMKVGTNAKSKGGFNYPQALHEGTGKFKGSRDGGYTTGRVRASNFYGFGNRNDMEAFFASNTKRKGGIIPNKFADRAKKTSEPIFFKQFIKHVALLNKEQINVN